MPPACTPCADSRRACMRSTSAEKRGRRYLSDLRSQPLTATLVDRATHIFAMTGAHLETIHLLFPQGAEKTFLLREFEEPGTTVWRDVPDPIGMSRDVYSNARRRSKTLYRACSPS